MPDIQKLPSTEPIWHELVEEVDHLPVYISTPGRSSCNQAASTVSAFPTG